MVSELRDVLQHEQVYSGSNQRKSAAGKGFRPNQAVGDVKTGGSKTRPNSHEKYRTSKQHKMSPEEMMALVVIADGGHEVISSNRMEAHIDWLQFAGYIQAGQLYSFIGETERLTGELLQVRLGKSCASSNGEYKNSAYSLKRIRIAWDDQDENGKCRFLISIPGKVVSAMKMLKIRELALAALTVGLHCTRLDSAIDDFGKRLSFQTILAALLAKNYSKFRTWDLRYSMGGGICIYFGSRESARCTKLYDKFKESKGKINAYRAETKFNNKIAQQVLLGWLMIDPDELGDCWERESAKYLMESVIGSIDFIDRASKPNEKNLNRLPRLDWWQAFMDLIGEGIYHTAPRIETSLEKSAKWHKRSTLRSLVCILKALGNDAEAWILNQLEEAELSLTATHQHRISQFKQEWKSYKTWTADRALDMAVA